MHHHRAIEPLSPRLFAKFRSYNARSLPPAQLGVIVKDARGLLGAELGQASVISVAHVVA